jgi:hypothetical protein
LPPIEVCVDPTGEGIYTANTLDGVDSGPTGKLDEDSNIDENEDIVELEMRDFDEVEVVEDDLE